MTSRLRSGIIAGLTVGAIVAGATLLSLVANTPSQNTDLAGDFVHDFGVVMLSNDGPVVLPHTFTMTNTLDHPVHIGHLTSSCGCTVAEVEQDVVQPGESVDVNATLELASSGRRDSSITINLGNDGFVILNLSASGQRAQDIRALQSTVCIGTSDRATVTLMASDVESDRRPDEPRIETPSGIVASFEGWTRVQARDERHDRPARWSGTLRLTATRRVETLAPAARRIVIHMDNRDPIEIPLLEIK